MFCLRRVGRVELAGKRCKVTMIVCFPLPCSQQSVNFGLSLCLPLGLREKICPFSCGINLHGRELLNEGSITNKWMNELWLFSHESKSVQFELSFELRYLNYHSNDGILDRVYAKLHHDAWSELRNSNDGLDHHLNCAFQIMHRDVIWHTYGPKYRHSNDNSNCTV